MGRSRIAVALVAWLAACSASPSSPTGASSGAGGASSGSSASSTEGVGGSFASSSGSGGQGASGGGCVGIASVAEPVPLDLFVMLDQSGSMLQDAGNNLSRWASIKSAITTFVGQPNVVGIGMGLQYFGLPDPAVLGCPALGCSTDGDCAAMSGCTTCGPGGVCHAPFNPDIDACDASEYAWAEVPIAPLPQNGPLLLGSLSMHAPGTNTPTLPALEGAIQYASSWAVAHPDHITAVILATDGLPSECDTDQGHLGMAAAAGYLGTPSIKTFVLGVGPALAELDALALAGGTGAAFHVDFDPNATTSLVAALNTIRGAALACTYMIPSPPVGMILDKNFVNVTYTPPGGSPKTIPKVANAAACPASGDGWYYDDDASPTAILLCPFTCDGLTDVLGGELDIVLGCATITD